MCAKARLAKPEFTRDLSVSVKINDGFPGSNLHGHDFYELDVISSGSARSTTNGKSSVVRGGTVIFMTPADFHDYSECDGVNILNIQFVTESISGDILGRLEKSKNRIFSLDEESFREISNIFSVMNSLSKKGSFGEPIITRLLESILLMLPIGAEGADGDSKASAPASKIMQKAIVYIHEHFKENPSLSEIAAIIPLNERYFCTRFREYTGVTYKEYLKKLKLRYARRLLLVTELSVTEISEASGYFTQSHFNREFKSYYGVTPIAMRKSSH